MSTINRDILAHRMGEKTGLTATLNLAAINALVDVVNDCAVQRESVYIHGLGTFKVKDCAARVGRNPKTKEVIDIPAKVKLVFTPAKHLKDI